MWGTYCEETDNELLWSSEPCKQKGVKLNFENGSWNRSKICRQ